MDKLGAGDCLGYPMIHEEQVNNLGNFLSMLAPCMLPFPNKEHNHIFFTFELFSRNSLYTSARQSMSVEMMT